jgi:hypothetical protein
MASFCAQLCLIATYDFMSLPITTPFVTGQPTLTCFLVVQQHGETATIACVTEAKFNE